MTCTIAQNCANRPGSAKASLALKEALLSEKSEKETLPSKYLDRRVVERYIKKGMVDEKEFARLLKTLPDLAETASKVDTEFTSDGELGPAR